MDQPKKVQRKKFKDFPINVDDIFSRLSLASQELLIRSPVVKSILKPCREPSKLATSDNDFSKKAQIAYYDDKVCITDENDLASRQETKIDRVNPINDRSRPSSPMFGLPYDGSHHTSPGSSNALHDVSSGTAVSIPYSGGAKSPAKFSLTRSRNLKEYDEELDRLTKENVDLKIRIHLMEDRFGAKPQKFEKNGLKKAYFELQMETDDLRKKYNEKQELVQKASKLLLVLDTQYKTELDQVKDSHDKITADLNDKIDQLKKELEKLNKNSNTARADLTQLCDLAFDAVEEEGEIPSAFSNQVRKSLNACGTPVGIFSIPANELSSCGLPLQKDEELSVNALNKIKDLEEQLVSLEAKVTTLDEQLQEKQRTSDALEEDVNNLKKELEDREERLGELEFEMTEKEQKLDHMMQDLETRHLEIKAKDTTIQTLHDDLNKVEPEIEVKVQQIIERDKIIEEKIEQLQHQNKILVEIQITLDEKQKQIAELEALLREEQEKCEKVTKEVQCSAKALDMFLEKIEVLNGENSSLKKEVRRKEKKIRDLVAELKESLELINKTKWEAETSGCEDGVKEMVEEENERLWAELEQKKVDLISLRNLMDSSTKEAGERIKTLAKQVEDSEMKLKNLQKLLEDNQKGKVDGGCGGLDLEIVALKEKLESRDAALRNQNALMENLKGELSSTRIELRERKEEMKELKTLLFQKNSDVQDFITKELFGRNQELRDLQGKLCGFNSGQEKHLDFLKMFIEAKGFSLDPKDDVDIANTGSVPQAQVRSNSLSNLNNEPAINEENDHENKAGRSNSFSTLENALYAQMGQKVYNTNQTFNTYVLSGESDGKQGQDGSFMNENSILPTEALRKELNLNDSLPECEAKTLLNNILSKSKDKDVSQKTSSNDEVNRSSSSIQTDLIKIDPRELQLVHEEMGKYNQKIQALMDEKESLSLSLQNLKKSDNDSINSLLQKELEVSRETTTKKDEMHGEMVSDFQLEIESLKQELKGTKKKIITQVLEVASNKYQESLQKYKQEISSLRKRLADSHNACDLLRNRLEELVEFLEQILELEKQGILSLSHLTSSRRLSLQKTLDDSRALSQSLSHSLMIGAESSLLEDLDTTLTPFEVPLDQITEEIDLAHFNLSMAANILAEDRSRLLNMSSDSHKDLIQALLASEMDAKSEEMDATVVKLNQLSNIVQVKDDRIREQIENISALQSEVNFLQNELRYKDQLLYQYQAGDSGCSSLCANPQSVNCVSSPISSVAQNDSNSSLHLSALQLSVNSIQPDFTKDAIVHPDSNDQFSSGSTSLPPPPSSVVLSQDDVIKSNLVSEAPSIYSTDVIIHRTSNKGATDSRDGMVLDQLGKDVMLPALNLASPSESEAWSEPDRNVSLARIGLDACNLVAINHDRSRSRTTKSAPFTSESEGETHADDNRDGTPCNKSKRRSDAVEVKRLASKLRNAEQMNETLRAELHIYQTLSQQFSTSEKCHPPQTNDKSNGAFESDTATETESSITIPSSLFQEIRCLRRKLEEAITNNDLLRDQLEAALSGYLSEETRNLAGKLSAAQHEIMLYKEQLATATAIEQKLTHQLKETDAQVFELNDRLSHYLSNSEKMDAKIQQTAKELKNSKETISQLKSELKDSEGVMKTKDRNIESLNLKIHLLETEVSSLKVNMERITEITKEMEVNMKEKNSCINEIEDDKKELQQRILNMQNDLEIPSRNKIDSLETKLYESEQKRLKVSKENLSLVKEISKMQSKLESHKAESKILKLEVKELSTSENSSPDKEFDSLNRRFKELQLSSHELRQNNENMKGEKQALQKEMQLLQEEVAALRSHLDHVLARGTKIDAKQMKDQTSLQLSFESISDHSCLQDKNSSLHSEWISLKENLENVKDLEAEFVQTNIKLKEIETKNQELVYQLDAERCQTRNLQMQNNSLQSKLKSLREYTHSRHSSNSAQSLTNVELIRNVSESRRKVDDIKKSKDPVRPSSISLNDNKENLFPSDRNLFLSHFEDDAMSGDSPDLGIGSDGHFSSMEKLNNHDLYRQDVTCREIVSKLCSDPSHSRLMCENERLRQEKDTINAKLKSTKETLKETLDHLSKANTRKESVERAIYRQLSKTHDVLRQASGNLRNSKQTTKSTGELT